MLGHTLVTLQTGPAGRVVKRIYIEEGAKIAKELYLSALVDRETGRVAFVASEAGGMNIEEVAHDTPEKITTVGIDPSPARRALMPRRSRPRSALTGALVDEAQDLADQALQGASSRAT